MVTKTFVNLQFKKMNDVKFKNQTLITGGWKEVDN